MTKDRNQLLEFGTRVDDLLDTDRRELEATTQIYPKLVRAGDK